MFLRGEEIVGEVEGIRRPVRLETYAVLPRDIGKPVGDIRPAGENNAFDFRADRRQRGADIVAAVEEGGAPRLGDGLACRGDERLEPARTHIAAGIRRAGERDRPAGRGRQRARFERAYDDRLPSRIASLRSQ